MEHREMTPMPVVLVGPLRVTPETITTPVGTSVKQHNTILNLCQRGNLGHKVPPSSVTGGASPYNLISSHTNNHYYLSIRNIYSFLCIATEIAKETGMSSDRLPKRRGPRCEPMVVIFNNNQGRGSEPVQKKHNQGKVS